MTIDPAIFFFYISSRSFSVTQHFHFHVLYSASHCHWHCGTKAVTVPSTGQCSVNGLFLPFLSTLFRSIQQRHAAYRKQGRKREREKKEGKKKERMYKKRKRADRNINNKRRGGGGGEKIRFENSKSLRRGSILELPRGKQDALKFPQTSFRLMSTVVFS